MSKLISLPAGIAGLIQSEPLCAYDTAIHQASGITVIMARTSKDRVILAIAPKDTDAGFCGKKYVKGDVSVIAAPLTADNAAILRKLFPWTKPVPVLRKKRSFGCGDRLGIATRGHAATLARYQAAPVFAQQSVRELTLTGRTFQSVIDDASFEVFEAGYTGGFGADGDHLKSFDMIETALKAGVTMLTLDLSEQLKPAFADVSGAELEKAYLALPAELRARLEKTYLAAPIQLKNSKLTFSETELRRCALIYTQAMDFAAQVGELLAKQPGGPVDLEVSIDETTAPTLPEHHYFVASELVYRKVAFQSLAPRFIGDFQKGIDYIGDLDEFKRQLKQHAEIADTFGSYKISVHSGSDKFAVFPAVSELTDGHFHLKTAGTSWLEALHVLAYKRPELFKRIYARAWDALSDALKLYHITADFSVLPKADAITDAELPNLLKDVAGRQLLHITYGAMVGPSSPIRNEIYEALHQEDACYEELLDKHFTKHLSLLNVPARTAPIETGSLDAIAAFFA